MKPNSDDPPFVPLTSPMTPILVLFGVGLVLGLFIALRNCCTKQLLSHHLQKKIARGGILEGKKGKEDNLFTRQPSDYGSIVATHMFEDLYHAMTRRKEKSGKPARLPKAKKISILHNSLCTRVTQIEQTLPLHIRTHSTFPILSLIIQDYVVFVRSSLIPVTTKFIIFCNELTTIQATISNSPTEGQWQQLGTLLEEKVQWMTRFAEEVLRNSGELQVMAHKMFRIINAMYEEMRMSSVTQNLASEASKTEYVFHLLAIYDSFKKMSVILQFARDEIDSTTFHLAQVQHLLDTGNSEELAHVRVFRGEVVQILASDATEQQQQAEALASVQRGTGP